MFIDIYLYDTPNTISIYDDRRRGSIDIDAPLNVPVLRAVLRALHDRSPAQYHHAERFPGSTCRWCDGTYDAGPDGRPGGVDALGQVPAGGRRGFPDQEHGLPAPEPEAGGGGPDGL